MDASQESVPLQRVPPVREVIERLYSEDVLTRPASSVKIGIKDTGQVRGRGETLDLLRVNSLRGNDLKPKLAHREGTYIERQVAVGEGHVMATDSAPP